MKYTIRWELYEEKSPILWEKYDYQFPRFTPYDGFYCIFLNYEKLMGKPLHIPYAELYHKMEIKWEKCTHIMGKVWASISQTFSIQWILLHFPIPWEIYGETHAFPIWCHWLIFSYTTHPPSCILPSFFQNTSQLLLPRRLWKFESTISFWKCKRKVVFLVIYLFNYDWSKSIFFMLNYGIAFSWDFSCAQFWSNKLEFFISCNKIKGCEAIM